MLNGRQFFGCCNTLLRNRSHCFKHLTRFNPHLQVQSIPIHEIHYSYIVSLRNSVEGFALLDSMLTGFFRYNHFNVAVVTESTAAPSGAGTVATTFLVVSAVATIALSLGRLMTSCLGAFVTSGFVVSTTAGTITAGASNHSCILCLCIGNLRRPCEGVCFVNFNNICCNNCFITVSRLHRRQI